MKLYGTYLFLGIDNTHMGPMCSIYIVLLWWSKETAKNDNHTGLEKRISGAFSWLLYNCGQTFSPTFIEQSPLKNHTCFRIQQLKLNFKYSSYNFQIVLLINVKFGLVKRAFGKKVIK